MPPPFNLSEGAIAMISSGELLGIEPVLQIASIRIVKTLNQNDKTLRYAMWLSDGTFSLQGMLATKHNELVLTEKLQMGSIVRLKEFTSKEIQHQILVIVLELDVIVEKCDLIGEPRQYPPRTYVNASSLPRPFVPVQSINQPAAASVNHPFYCAASARTVSVPRPNMGGGI